MNTILAPLLRRCVLVFFDDILVYSATFEDHLQHLQQVFHLLQSEQWKIKLTKCCFARTQISYLGHVISKDGVAIDIDKVLVVAAWPVPSNVKELHNFPGMAGYYRKYVKHFGIINTPLTNLLKKNTMFIWTRDHQTTIGTLKQALVSAPVLALPNFSKPFVIETDATEAGVGAVLMQEGHPLTFLSKALGPKSRGYPHVKKST
jgi:hypothetical protein